jgi:PhzF family phenazine biosynthesis protein
MPDSLPFFLVDAFAEQAFRGNPAGVVLDADKLTAGQMQHIAREVNASETSFVSRTRDLHRPPHIRWFAPASEVSFCGHATLAAAHALYERGDLGTSGSRTLELASAAGLLQLVREVLPEPEQMLWWLDLPQPVLRTDPTNLVRLAELLGTTPQEFDPALPTMRTGDADLICFVRSWPQLMELRPNFQELAAWCERQRLRGICVATTNTLSPTVNVHSRFFAPAVGVAEDPVTGSVHGPLAVYLVVNNLVPVATGRSGLFCAQGRPGDRSGLVRALVEATPDGYRARIGGLCHVTVRGEMRVPDTA